MLDAHNNAPEANPLPFAPPPQGGGTEADSAQALRVPFVKRLLSSGALRFAGWWSIFAGALALNSVCPICGGAACPVGIGTTGVIAAVLAGAKQWGGRIIGAITRRVRPAKSGGACVAVAGSHADPHHESA